MDFWSTNRTRKNSFVAPIRRTMEATYSFQLDAARSGARLRAHRYTKQAFLLDSEFYAGYVGLGAVNFFAGSLPGVLKPFAFLVCAWGDKETGAICSLSRVRKLVVLAPKPDRKRHES